MGATIAPNRAIMDTHPIPFWLRGHGRKLHTLTSVALENNMGFWDSCYCLSKRNKMICKQGRNHHINWGKQVPPPKIRNGQINTALFVIRMTKGLKVTFLGWSAVGGLTWLTQRRWDLTKRDSQTSNMNSSATLQFLMVKDCEVRCK